MDGIDEHHARNLLTMARGEHTEVDGAEVVPNENVRSGNRGAGEQALQFAGNIYAGPRLIGRVAPSKTGAIVRTSPGKSSDLWLNQLPNNRRVVWTGLHDYGGTSCTRAVDVEAATHQCPRVFRGRIAMALPLRHRELKYSARK